jgi:hypothetical protein
VEENGFLPLLARSFFRLRYNDIHIRSGYIPVEFPLLELLFPLSRTTLMLIYKRNIAGNRRNRHVPCQEAMFVLNRPLSVLKSSIVD